MAARKVAKPKPPEPARSGRPPLAVNVRIGSKWYGPAWGNADQYPDEGHDGRPELFGD